MILLDGRNLNPLLFKFEQFWGWHLFWNILPNFLPSHIKFPGHKLSVSFCSAFSSSTSILWDGVSDGDAVESSVCYKLDLSPCFPVQWRPPILLERGWLVAVPAFPSHSSFERGRCAPSLLSTSVTHTETGNLFRSPGVLLLGLGILQTLGDMRTLVCGHWSCTFFACLIVKFVFPNFILFFIFSSHFGGTKPPLNVLCSEWILVSLLMMRIVCP